MEKSPITQPRTTKRFKLSATGTCTTHTKESFPIQLVDISATGIHFHSKNSIHADEKPIWLKWNDPDLGEFNVGMMLVRKSEVLAQNEATFSYGSQYCNLNEQAKIQLVNLLKKLKVSQKQNVTRDVETITPKYLFEVISRSKDFLRESFQHDTSQLKSVLADIKDYEKEFFKAQGPAAEYVQTTVTNGFHLKLLGVMIPMIAENPLEKSQFFNQTVDTLDSITNSEATQDLAITAIGDDVQMRKQVIESSNRLFYEKHKFLQATVDTFDMFDDPENAELFAQIKNEYERVVEVTSQNVIADQQTYARKTKIVERTREDLINEISINTDKKPSYVLWINSFLLLLAAAGYVTSWFLQNSDISNINDKIQLTIDIKDFKRSGSQIDIYVDKNDWKRLSADQKLAELDKLIKYLQEDKKVEFALLFTDDGTMVKMVNERTNLRPSTAPKVAPAMTVSDPETPQPETPTEQATPETAPVAP